jgi:hypothetical protein
MTYYPHKFIVKYEDSNISYGQRKSYKQCELCRKVYQENNPYFNLACNVAENNERKRIEKLENKKV